MPEKIQSLEVWKKDLYKQIIFNFFKAQKKNMNKLMNENAIKMEIFEVGGN